MNEDFYQELAYISKEAKTMLDSPELKNVIEQAEKPTEDANQPYTDERLKRALRYAAQFEKHPKRDSFPPATITNIARICDELSGSPHKVISGKGQLCMDVELIVIHFFDR